MAGLFGVRSRCSVRSDVRGGEREAPASDSARRRVLGLEPRTCASLVGLAVAAMTLSIGGQLSAAPQAARDREQLVRGALLYKFAKFVEWPKGLHEASDSIQICVLGDSELVDLLGKNISKLVVKGHSVEARSLERADQARSCHVVYYAATDDLSSALRAIDGAAVLTVASQSGFLEIGGMINLVRREEAIGFEINLAASRKAGLSLSSRLREVAVRVASF